MPKFVKYRVEKYKDLKKKERATKYRVFGYDNWIDRFPLGFGTKPEKIVYQALSERGIPFQYLNDITFSNPEIEFFKKYQADFIIPSLRIIIEVQGWRWHSTPQAIESDALKFAVYKQFGWHALAWWDFEIEADVNQLFLREPLFAGYNAGKNVGSTEFVVKRTKTDSSKGIRTQNQNRKARYAYRKEPVTVKGRKLKPTGGSYKVYGR